MNKSKLFLSALAACSVAISLEAGAQEFKPQVWVNPGLFSYHFDRDKDYREKNWGVGAEYVFRPNHAAMIGTVINSENHRSRYLGYQWRPLHWQPYGVDVHAGVALSVVDGYPTMNNKGWFIAPMPMLAIEGKWLGANVMLLPNMKHGGAIALQLKLKVW
jgi:hypothetical protein